ncbi:SGNH/GDSL hydrolase family protein [Pontibacterium granulatum]|uniref:SGNH/GDSL hydrolase family protein n=1 Tax=Pontibacterium granulatum TaxID=2036029 RepID=UPI00249A6950|nr:SGNH/GDSL hydrolase family protein [Pontibacterium granulatum]MDI3326801.1 SGNH/GDSL hydrolase family protein [Pontibacterium granulatum]
MLKNVLVYSDSLTWGIVPGTRQRLDFDQRWPGVLENGLILDEHHVRVVEDCLNGRRTVLEDPFKAGRNGQEGLAQTIEKHSPLALVIIMLGNNDLQSMHTHTAWHVAQGIASLIDEVRNAPIEPGMPQPPILVVCPPVIQSPKGPIADKFVGAEEKAVGLAREMRNVAATKEVHFFDAATVTSTSPVDGVHLDADQHFALGRALVDVVDPILARDF